MCGSPLSGQRRLPPRLPLTLPTPSRTRHWSSSRKTAGRDTLATEARDRSLRLRQRLLIRIFLPDRPRKSDLHLHRRKDYLHPDPPPEDHAITIGQFADRKLGIGLDTDRCPDGKTYQHSENPRRGPVR